MIGLVLIFDHVFCRLNFHNCLLFGGLKGLKIGDGMSNSADPYQIADVGGVGLSCTVQSCPSCKDYFGNRFIIT